MGRTNASWIQSIRDDYDLDLSVEVEHEFHDYECNKILEINCEDLLRGTFAYDPFNNRYISTYGKAGKRNLKHLEKRLGDSYRGYPETAVERDIRKWRERWEKFPPHQRKTRIALWYLDEYLLPEQRTSYHIRCEGSPEKLVDLLYEDCMAEVEYLSMNDPDPARALYLLEQSERENPIYDDEPCWWHRKPATISPEIPEYLMKKYRKWAKKHPPANFLDISANRRKFLRKYLKKDRKKQNKLLYGNSKGGKHKRDREDEEARRKALSSDPLFPTAENEDDILQAIYEMTHKTEELSDAFAECVAYDITPDEISEEGIEKLNRTFDQMAKMRHKCQKTFDDYSMRIASSIAAKGGRPKFHSGRSSPPVTLCLDDGRVITYNTDGSVASERYDGSMDIRKRKSRRR